MKKRESPLAKLRRTAWCGLGTGSVIAIAFLVLAAVSMDLRRSSHRYWRTDQVEPFKQDCLSALASSPDVAARFECFCGHFDIATEMAQDFMGFLAFFSVVVAGLAIGQVIFSRMVLKQIKQDEIHSTHGDVPDNSFPRK